MLNSNSNTLLQIPFRDYCQKLALALTSNPKTALHSVSLNGNAIEDRGMFCNNRIKINHKKTVYPSRDSYSNKNGRSLSCFSTIIFMPLNNKNYKSLSYITNYIVLSTFCDFLFWVVKMQSSVMAIKIRMVDLKACMRKK